MLNDSKNNQKYEQDSRRENYYTLYKPPKIGSNSVQYLKEGPNSLHVSITHTLFRDGSKLEKMLILVINLFIREFTQLLYWLLCQH